jgi:hypothetical protein
VCSFSEEGEQEVDSLSGFAFANGEVCEEPASLAIGIILLTFALTGIAENSRRISSAQDTCSWMARNTSFGTGPGATRRSCLGPGTI